jgi:hypothetical protein
MSEAIPPIPQCLYGKHRGTPPFTLYKISGQPPTNIMFNKLSFDKRRKSWDIRSHNNERRIILTYLTARRL